MSLLREQIEGIAPDKINRGKPHKAILLLSIIEMLETGVIKENKIYYDSTLNGIFYNKLQKIRSKG